VVKLFKQFKVILYKENGVLLLVFNKFWYIGATVKDMSWQQSEAA
jgi:hypothetical protein